MTNLLSQQNNLSCSGLQLQTNNYTCSTVPDNDKWTKQCQRIHNTKNSTYFSMPWLKSELREHVLYITKRSECFFCVIDNNTCYTINAVSIEYLRGVGCILYIFKHHDCNLYCLIEQPNQFHFLYFTIWYNRSVIPISDSEAAMLVRVLVPSSNSFHGY